MKRMGCVIAVLALLISGMSLDAVAADFLGKYLSDPQFPGCKADVPEDYQESEHGELILNAGFIRWDHPYDAYLRLNTNLVLENISDEDYTFDFWYEHPEELQRIIKKLGQDVKRIKKPKDQEGRFRKAYIDIKE